VEGAGPEILTLFTKKTKSMPDAHCASKKDNTLRWLDAAELAPVANELAPLARLPTAKETRSMISS
jgi:hypothetical protein